MRRFLRRFVLALRVGYHHAAWGYSLRESYQHLRRPQPIRVVFGLGLNLATHRYEIAPTTMGCFACPTRHELEAVR